MRYNTLILLAVLILTSCDPKRDMPEVGPSAVPVLTAMPEVKDIPVYIESIGLLHPSVSIDVYPQVSGMVTEVLVAEGQWVQEGTPLFQIDPRPYMIKVQEAQAQLSIDQAAFQSAQKKLGRFRDLAQKDLIPQTEWDDLESEGVRASATLLLDEARLDAAKLDLERCLLTSPIAGRVGKLDAHPGHLVASGQATPLVTLSKMDPLKVEFTITESEFRSMPKEAREMDIQILCLSDSCKKGAITFLDNQFDPQTGLILVRGNLINPDYLLRPGQSIKIRVPIVTRSNLTLIPQKAVRYNQSGPYVYVVQEDQTVALRQITLGEENGESVIVLENLTAADRVITDGHLRLFPGIKVEIN